MNSLSQADDLRNSFQFLVCDVGPISLRGHPPLSPAIPRYPPLSLSFGMEDKAVCFFFLSPMKTVGGSSEITPPFQLKKKRLNFQITSQSSRPPYTWGGVEKDQKLKSRDELEKPPLGEVFSCFLYFLVLSCALLSLLVPSCTFLYFLVPSCTFLYFLVLSCTFLSLLVPFFLSGSLVV